MMDALNWILNGTAAHAQRVIDQAKLLALEELRHARTD